MKETQIYKKLIEKYKDKQLIVAIEELSELAKALCKYLRGNNDQPMNIDSIIEEIADVEIMLEQVKMYFGITNLNILLEKKKKLKRTEERLLYGFNK